MFTRCTSHFSLRLFSFGWERTRPERWRDQDAGSVFWTLYRNARDGGFIRVGETTIPLVTGKNYIIPPDCRYDYWCDRDIDHLFIFFDILGFTRRAIYQLFPEPIPLSLSQFSADAMADIAAHPQREVSLVTQWRCMVAISEGLLHNLEALPPERQEQGRQLTDDKTPVTAALQHIDVNLTERLSNHDLAARCSMSGDYFIRQFREYIGQTPTQYVLETRVRKAAELLLFSELSLEEIASQVGFGNRHYLSRVFARQMGMGPADFRKRRHGY